MLTICALSYWGTVIVKQSTDLDQEFRDFIVPIRAGIVKWHQTPATSAVIPSNVNRMTHTHTHTQHHLISLAASVTDRKEVPHYSLATKIITCKHNLRSPVFHLSHCNTDRQCDWQDCTHATWLACVTEFHTLPPSVKISFITWQWRPVVLYCIIVPQNMPIRYCTAGPQCLLIYPFVKKEKPVLLMAKCMRVQYNICL